MSRRAVSVLVVFRWLARGALLAAWALTGWGTLLLVVTLANAVGQGPRAALASLLPAAGGSVWDVLNGFSAALALVIWLTVAALVLLWRWQSQATSGEARPPGVPPEPAPGPEGTGRPAPR